jgi:protein TonB
MYEALRQRAPTSSKITGVTATALALAGAAYVAISGLGEQVAKALTDRPIFVIVPPTHSDPPPISEQKLDTSTETLAPVAPIWTPPDFRIETDSIIVPKKDPPPTGEVRASVAPAGPAPTRPKMLDTAKPSYPLISVRLQEQGTTAIQLCISPAGRVTAATLAQSSGHSRLDDAAMKWIRGVRFTPGTADGRPAAVCGHTVSYEWKIEGLR